MNQEQKDALRVIILNHSFVKRGESPALNALQRNALQADIEELFEMSPEAVAIGRISAYMFWKAEKIDSLARAVGSARGAELSAACKKYMDFDKMTLQEKKNLFIQETEKFFQNEG